MKYTMKYAMRVAIVAIALPAAAAPAFAYPPGEYPVTNVPWGTTDSAPGGFGGGEGGPNMRISEQGHLDWPNFSAPVENSAVAANSGANGAVATLRR